MSNNGKKENVTYNSLKTLAKYDFDISDILFSMIKFMECSIRGYICNLYGNEKIKKETYLYDISEAFKTEKKLPCDTHYENKLKDKCTIDKFLKESGMCTLNKLFLNMKDDDIKKYMESCGEKYNPKNNESKKELEEIKDIRNILAHNKVLLDNYKKYKEYFNKIAKYIPNNEIVDRKKKAIKDLNKSFKKDGNLNIEDWFIEVN